MLLAKVAKASGGLSSYRPWPRSRKCWIVWFTTGCSQMFRTTEAFPIGIISSVSQFNLWQHRNGYWLSPGCDWRKWKLQSIRPFAVLYRNICRWLVFIATLVPSSYLEKRRQNIISKDFSQSSLLRPPNTQSLDWVLGYSDEIPLVMFAKHLEGADLYSYEVISAIGV